MRIGIEAQRIFRKKKHGMDIYALELIRQLQQLDKVNEYFIFVKTGEDHCLKETENFKIIEVKGLTYADWEQVSLPLAAAKYKVDVLHCTSNTGPIFSSIPLVLTLHDIIYMSQSFSGGSRYQQLGHYYRKWVVPHVYEKAKHVFTVSEFEKDHIANNFPNNDKVMAVYNGVSDAFRNAAQMDLNAVKAKYNLPEKYIFFLGNQVPKKNMKRMLQAYALYRTSVAQPLPLVVAESTAENLQNMLVSIGNEDLKQHITLTGYVSHKDLPVIYHLAELFVYPSLRESFGIPILEAMAAGTPVVTSNTSSMPEVAGGHATLCDPYSEKDLARSIVEAMGQITRGEVSEENLTAHAAKFTWKAAAETVLEKYQGLGQKVLI